jgi:hypothetical protein
MKRSTSTNYHIGSKIFFSILIIFQLFLNTEVYAQSDSVIINQKKSVANGRKYQPKTNTGISLGGTRPKINFFVISATESKAMWFELDAVDKWVDSLKKVNIKVVGNQMVDTVKRFCFDGPWYQLVRMQYGDTLRLVYNAYSQKSNNGFHIKGERPSVCEYQFYDDSGKPISTEEYEALLKRKNKWWRRLIKRKTKQ